MNHLALKSMVACAFALALSSAAFSADGDEIAVFAPLSGSNTIIGKQIEKAVSDSSVATTLYDDGCAAEPAMAAANQVLETTTRLIVGLPCVEALDAVATKVNETGSMALIMTLGVEAPDVTSRVRRENWPVFRLSPSSAQEAATVAAYISANWRGDNFAIIDDGTLYGRQLAENVRFALEEDNLKPVFRDAYRPLLDNQSSLVRRIAKSGATKVFIGGDAFDASIIGKDAKALGIKMQLLGGSAFRAPSDEGVLTEGTLYVAPVFLPLGANGSAKQHYETLTQIALNIGQQAITYANDHTMPLRDALVAQPYKTTIGDIQFLSNGENDRQWYSLFQVVGGRVQPIDGVN